MNALVKKEIRLLLSAWVAVLTLVLILPWFWKDPDEAISIAPALLFFGLVILAVNSFGREFSQGTFLSLLSQPIERREIWRTKILVLFVGAALIVAVGLAGSALRLETALAYGNSIWATNITLIRDDFRTSILASVAVLLVALSSGLWTTLLLRQITTALWISVLMPAAVLALIGVVMSQMFASASDTAVETVIYSAAAIYFILTFWLSRRLFYRAQDVGWSGGEITLPEWKWLSANSTNANLPHKRKPIFALLKKEFQLQQVSMAGAAGLFVLHLGVIAWRGVHTFEKDSAGEVLTSIFWMLWLIIPVVIGCIAVAEERKLGVMEGQLCLPVSRRLQFMVKGFPVLILGTLLGGVLPVILETSAIAMGLHSQVFDPEIHRGEFGLRLFQLSIVALSAGLALVSLFASSLARNFLQAIGYAIATVVVCVLIAAELTDWRGIFFNSISRQTMLPNLIAVPTIVILLLWLSYLNFKNFRDGWHLLRRTLLGFIGAFVFIVVMSIALYNRAWEIFQPAEPPHGPAKFSLANPPDVRGEYNNLLVTLPDGRVWNLLLQNYQDFSHWSRWKPLLPEDVLPRVTDQSFIAGSNWSSVIETRIAGPFPLALGMVGIQKDGSLWYILKNQGADSELFRLGNETNWRQAARAAEGILLLNGDGSLLRWDRKYWGQMNQNPNFELTQVNTNSDWKELFDSYPGFARKSDDSVWVVRISKGKQELIQETNLNRVVFQTLSMNNGYAVFVRPDGTLWVGNFQSPYVKKDYLQVGKETNWVSVAVSLNMIIALKSDGSLYQWRFKGEYVQYAINTPPTRLGIHNDWVAIGSRWESVVALAADGSLWNWPDREAYEYGALLKLPKQPKFLGNVLGKTD